MKTKLVIGCNYHITWAKNKSMRFVLVELNGDVATMATRTTNKKFNCKIDDLIFIYSSHNKDKAKKIESSAKSVNNMNKKSHRDQVLEDYPKAFSKKVGNHYEIWSPEIYLGQGKNSKCAWISASRR